MSLKELRGPREVTIRRDIPMRTRDGEILLTDLYVPEGDSPRPTLLRRTPYGKNLNDLADPFNEAHYFASHGYLVAIQNTRGRFGSSGAWYPLVYEGRDGYDAIEWVATLAESNGRVGTFGQSYGAISQYLAASQRPPHLVTAIPVSAYLGSFENYWYNHGALELSWTLSYFANMAADALGRMDDRGKLDALNQLKVDPSERFSPLRDDALRSLPLVDWIDRFGSGAAFLKDILHHEKDGPYWWAVDLRRQFFNMDVPMLHVGSWYDIANWDTPQLFNGLRTSAMSEHARDHQALFLGPWSHLLPFSQPTSGGTGDIDFGPEAAFSMVEMQLEWFNHFVRDAATGLPRQRVTIFVMGDNTWRSETDWPLARQIEHNWLLSSRGDANTFEGDGRLVARQDEVDGAPDQYSYDPADPAPTLGGRYVGGGVRDQRPKAGRKDILFYRGDPLTGRLEITGNLRVELFASTDARDTDFVAILCDVHPDGFIQNLAEGIVRSRYREGFDHVVAMVPGAEYLFNIDMGNVSHAFAPGHSLLLMITSSDFPRWDRNLNTGASIASGTQIAIASQTIYHDALRPSRLVTPVIENTP